MNGADRHVVGALTMGPVVPMKVCRCVVGRPPVVGLAVDLARLVVF